MRATTGFGIGLLLGTGLGFFADRLFDTEPAARRDDDGERIALEARVADLLSEIDRLRGEPGLVAPPRSGPGPAEPDRGDPDRLDGEEPVDPSDVAAAVSRANHAYARMLGGDVRGASFVRLEASLSSEFAVLARLGSLATEELASRVRDESLALVDRVRAMNLLQRLDADRAALLASAMLARGVEEPSLLSALLSALRGDVVRASEDTLASLATRADLDLDVRHSAVLAWMAGGSEGAVRAVEAWLEGGPVERALAARALPSLPPHAPGAAALLRRALFADGVLDAGGRQTVSNALADAKSAAWSAAQLVGPPDTSIAGDHRSAWASKAPDMGHVTIELGFADSVRPDAVRIHETFHPGAVIEIQVSEGGGDWITLWAGVADPAPAPRWFEPTLASSAGRVDRVRLVLNTDRVAGWNEIDAVALVGDGLEQWASTATASSSYSD